MSEFGDYAKREDRGSVVPHIILRKYRLQASFLSKEVKMEGVGFVKTEAPSRIYLMTSMSEAGNISLNALGKKCRLE